MGVSLISPFIPSEITFLTEIGIFSHKWYFSKTFFESKKVVESVSKETYFTAEEKEALEAKIAELEAKVTELSKEEETVEEEVVEEVELAEQTVEPIKYNPENQVEQAEGFRFSQNRKETLQDRVRKSIFSK